MQIARKIRKRRFTRRNNEKEPDELDKPDRRRKLPLERPHIIAENSERPRDECR